MRRAAYVPVLFTGLLVVGVITGCAAPSSDPPPASRTGVPAVSIAVDSFPTEDSTLRPPPEGQSNVVIDPTAEPPTLTVTSWGSSSCPAIPVGIAWQGSTTLALEMARSNNMSCTADSVPFSHVVEIPVENSVDDAVEVLVNGKAVPHTTT